MIPDKIILAKQIVEAVMSLHQSDVIHRDVKPSNFLIDDCTDNKNTYQLKIIDFA
jgi:serine/threonine protein kinase